MVLLNRVVESKDDASLAVLIWVRSTAAAILLEMEEDIDTSEVTELLGDPARLDFRSRDFWGPTLERLIDTETFAGEASPGSDNLVCFWA